MARVSDAHGKWVTLHRTYLTEAGRKAPVENQKRMMPVPSDQLVLGGAIRLGFAGPVIDLAEGIETVLAVRQATGLSVWSAVSATLLAGFDPPPRTENVRIWCDRDRKGVGEEAAHKLAARLAERGIPTELLIPPEAMLRDGKGVDWLDVLNDYGPAAFPLSPNRRAAA